MTNQRKTGALLGIHTIRPTARTLGWIEQCAKAGAPLCVVKALNDGGLLVETKRISPSTTTVFRRVGERNNPGDTYTGRWGEPAFRREQARQQILWHLARLSPQQLQCLDILEVINEPSPPRKSVV